MIQKSFIFFLFYLAMDVAVAQNGGNEETKIKIGVEYNFCSQRQSLYVRHTNQAGLVADFRKVQLAAGGFNDVQERVRL